MSHIKMSNVTHVTLLAAKVTSHAWMSHVIQVESLYKSDIKIKMSHFTHMTSLWKNHVLQINWLCHSYEVSMKESCHTYELQVMSYIWMSPCAHTCGTMFQSQLWSAQLSRTLQSECGRLCSLQVRQTCRRSRRRYNCIYKYKNKHRNI